MHIISFATAESDWKSPRMGMFLKPGDRMEVEVEHIGGSAIRSKRAKRNGWPMDDLPQPIADLVEELTARQAWRRPCFPGGNA